MCWAMLISTTFAWFTDTASTGVNKIQAGNLEIELQMKDNNGNWVNAEGKTLPFLVEGKIPAKGTQILWEPGCTYYVPEVRVVNKGNLAVKFEYVNELLGVTGKLAEVLEPVFKTPVDANGEEVNIEPEILKPDEASPAWSFGYHMLETAGNEYQNATATGMYLTVVATQATYEKDSKDDQYDKDAEYPVVVTDEASLKEALAAGKSLYVVMVIPIVDNCPNCDASWAFAVSIADWAAAFWAASSCTCELLSSSPRLFICSIAWSSWAMPFSAFTSWL